MYYKAPSFHEHPYTDTITISDALSSAPISRIDAEVLLAALLDKNRAWLLIHDNQPLTIQQQSTWEEWLNLRQAHMPVAYLTGTQEFYGREFAVDSAVLIPRPATEGLIKTALEFLKSGRSTTEPIDAGIVAHAVASGKTDDIRLLVDIGTGSGCIAITLALELPDYRIIATDISDAALDIAKRNAKTHDVDDRIEFRKGEGTEPLQDLSEPFVIVSNPPYIPEGTKLMPDVKDFEPEQALFAGPDGMAVIRQIMDGAKVNPFCRGVVIECREDQIIKLA